MSVAVGEIYGQEASNKEPVNPAEVELRCNPISAADDEWKPRARRCRATVAAS